MKLITDVHNHSAYSFDCSVPLKTMIDVAIEKGVAFYGVSEHFDCDVYVHKGNALRAGKADAYFPDARRLQEEYAGVINVLVGAEFSYSDDQRVSEMYRELYENYRPDFVVNSIHTLRGEDYYEREVYYTFGEGGEKTLRDKHETYREYIAFIRKSLDAPYPYDIVGHFGYAARYAPYEDREIRVADYREEIDDLLSSIIKKDKILEVNGNSVGLKDPFVPSREILERYYALGGRKVSYGADAHRTDALGRNREAVVTALKEIGFTHLTVPCRGEHIMVEI